MNNGKEFIEMHGYDEYDYGARNYYPAIGRWTSIDAKCELAYDISPYTYCHNNPVNTIDIDGNIDWKVVGTGVLATASGIGSVVGGVGLTTSTCGFGTPVGAALITEGVASIGLGVTTMLYGAMTDQSPKNTEFLTKMPTSPSQAIAKSADIMAGNEHGQIETAVGIGMTAFSIATTSFKIPETITDVLMQAGSVAQTIMTISETKENIFKPENTNNTDVVPIRSQQDITVELPNFDVPCISIDNTYVTPAKHSY